MRSFQTPSTWTFLIVSNQLYHKQFYDVTDRSGNVFASYTAHSFPQRLALSAAERSREHGERWRKSCSSRGNSLPAKNHCFLVWCKVDACHCFTSTRSSLSIARLIATREANSGTESSAHRKSDRAETGSLCSDRSHPFSCSAAEWSLQLYQTYRSRRSKFQTARKTQASSDFRSNCFLVYPSDNDVRLEITIAASTVRMSKESMATLSRWSWLFSNVTLQNILWILDTAV